MRVDGWFLGILVIVATIMGYSEFRDCHRRHPGMIPLPNWADDWVIEPAKLTVIAVIVDLLFNVVQDVCYHTCDLNGVNYGRNILIIVLLFIGFYEVMVTVRRVGIIIHNYHQRRQKRDE